MSVIYIESKIPNYENLSYIIKENLNIINYNTTGTTLELLIEHVKFLLIKFYQKTYQNVTSTTIEVSNPTPCHDWNSVGKIPYPVTTSDNYRFNAYLRDIFSFTLPPPLPPSITDEGILNTLVVSPKKKVESKKVTIFKMVKMNV